MTKPIINLFGVPEARLAGENIHSPAALDLLAVLVLLRHDPAAGTGALLQILGKEKVNPDRPIGEPESALRKRKGDLRRFGLGLPHTLKPSRLGPLIVEQADVDVAEFDAKIVSPDSREVRQAVALRRRGPLLAGRLESGFIEKERHKRDKLYQTALWRLIQEDRFSNPQEAVRWIDLLLDCPVPEQSRAVLQEDRLALEHDIFRASPAADNKTTQRWRPPPLPSPLTALIGRDAEAGTVQNLLFAHRFVTLEGTGGIGKTRLALAVAQGLQERFSGGAAFADFSAVSDAGQLSQQVGLCLGLEREEDRKPASLLAFLEDKSLLLVWDNCEHLVEACAAFATDILIRCPAIRILATSRETLRAYGEACYPVSVLPETEAVMLFMARAKAVKFDFQLTPQNTPVVSAICRDLDGLPLAIELAASLIKAQTSQQILSQLGQRFDLLSDGPRTGAVRHRSLRAVFDVSYELLKLAEQALFRRLGIFAGSFSAEAAAAVSADPSDVSAYLSNLVRCSLLLAAEPSGEEVRYRQLETVRHYAGERLRETGEWEDAQDKHRRHYLQVAEEAEPNLKGPDPKRWMDRLELEIANLRAALECRADETSVRIALALLRFWRARGYQEESWHWLEQGARTEEAVPNALRAKALNGAGGAAFVLGDFQDAQRLHEESLALSERIGNEAGRAEALNSLGGVAAHLGDYDKANTLIRASLALQRQQKDQEGAASCLSYAGMVANYQCDYRQAQALLEESLGIVQQLQDVHSIANCLLNLGIVAYYQADFSGASAYFEESLTLWRPLEDKYSMAKALNGLGEVALRGGNYQYARDIYAESLQQRQDAGDKYGIANSWNGLGEAALHLGEYPDAEEFFKKSMTLRQQIGDIQSVPHSLHNLGQLALRQNDGSAARGYFADSLERMRQNKDLYGVAHSLEGLAWAWLAGGDLAQASSAIWLLGAADLLRSQINSPHFPEDLEEHRSRTATLRRLLGKEAFAAAWACGQAMTWEQAVAFALGENAA